MSGDYLRIQWGTLQTPVHHYRNFATGRELTVVGIMPIGTTTYYARLYHSFMFFEAVGARVHTDGTFQGCAAGHGAADPDERQALAALERVEALVRRRAADIGWACQADAIPLVSSWQSHRLGHLGYIRAVGIQEAQEFADGMIRELDWPEHDTRSPNLWRLRIRQSLHRIAAIPDVPGTQPRQHDIDLAGKALDTTTHNTLLAWGTARLPAASIAAAARGFVRTGTTWRDVGRLPSRAAAAGRFITGVKPRRPGLNQAGTAS